MGEGFLGGEADAHAQTAGRTTTRIDPTTTIIVAQPIIK
jgi:hypothetical protein